MSSRLRIIVTGLVGMHPVGGVAWDYLQYVIGLARLGHDVYYHEDTWSWPYHPLERQVVSSGEYSALYIGDFFRRYAPQLQDHWHYLHLHETSFGMSRTAFDEVTRTADLFLNVSGACILPDELAPHCIKVFLDTDPGYNQIMFSERFAWSENVERWCASVRAHDRFLTYAENIHGPACTIPRLGFAWKPTRMPVVMDLWDSVARRQGVPTAPWTTVMTWNVFKGSLTYRGVEYGGKGPEFEKLMALPRRVPLPFRVAVGGTEAPLERLAGHGWEAIDGPMATLTPRRYQEFIARSRGEVSPAKHVYAAMHSGWFSCRSACYLAAGRPVVVQDTGFPAELSVGEGVLPFTTLEEAVRAVQEANANYTRHARAAREIAGDYFGSDRVLRRMVDDILSRNDSPQVSLSVHGD